MSVFLIIFFIFCKLFCPICQNKPCDARGHNSFNRVQVKSPLLSGGCEPRLMPKRSACDAVAILITRFKRIVAFTFS